MTKKDLLHKVQDFIYDNRSLFTLKTIEVNWEDGYDETFGCRTFRYFDLSGFGVTTIHGNWSNPCRSSRIMLSDSDKNNSPIQYEVCLCESIVTSPYLNHAPVCIPCIEKLKSIRPDIFGDLMGYFRSRSKVWVKDVWDKYEIVSDKKRFSSTAKGKPSVVSIKREPINNVTGLADVFLATSLVAQDYTDFPSARGVYLVRFLHEGSWVPLYCGKSEDIRTRWKNHHRIPEIQFLSNLGIQLEFRYLAETPLVKLSASLEEIESSLISEFRPKLNNAKVLSVGLGTKLVG